MKLKDILGIQPGTLIKGLHINQSGSIKFSLDGWKIEKHHFIRGLWSTENQEKYSFRYYQDCRVSSLLDEDKLLLHEPDNMSLTTFQRNGKVFYQDILSWTKWDHIESGECVGMSLGINFIAVKPSHADIYRPNSYEVYLFHKMLHAGTVKWIVLQSKTIDKKLIVPNPRTALLNIQMELI